MFGFHFILGLNCICVSLKLITGNYHTQEGRQRRSTPRIPLNYNIYTALNVRAFLSKIRSKILGLERKNIVEGKH